jgi:hypothetical protein
MVAADRWLLRSNKQLSKVRPQPPLFPLSINFEVKPLTAINLPVGRRRANLPKRTKSPPRVAQSRRAPIAADQTQRTIQAHRSNSHGREPEDKEERTGVRSCSARAASDGEVLAEGTRRPRKRRAARTILECGITTTAGNDCACVWKGLNFTLELVGDVMWCAHVETDSPLDVRLVSFFQRSACAEFGYMVWVSGVVEDFLTRTACTWGRLHGGEGTPSTIAKRWNTCKRRRIRGSDRNIRLLLPT